ncbi:MAG: AAA family ATPase [Alloprevotella sp.]
MKESVTIRNFGPINEACIKDLRPLTILIGESGSGKSTILKVVALFRYIYKMLNIRFYLKASQIDRSPFRIRLNDYFKANALNQYVRTDTEISYTVEFEHASYTLLYKNGKLQMPKSMNSEDLVYIKGSFVSENRNIIPTWSAKVASNRGATLGFYFHETYKDFEEATDHIDHLDLDFLNMKFLVRKVGGKKKYTVTDSKQSFTPIDLRAASSGMQTSIPLVTITNYFARHFDFKSALRRSVLSYLYDTDRLSKFQPKVELTELPKNIFIHVEEPELSLYPYAQMQLLDRLVCDMSLARTNGIRMDIMMATHSPYIVNYANLLLRRGAESQSAGPTADNVVRLAKDGISVFRVIDGTLQPLVGQDEDGIPIIDTYPLSEPMQRIYEEYVTHSTHRK